MATNLFEAFDSAFARPRPSLTAELVAGLGRRLDALRRRLRHGRDMRRVLELPTYLLDDIGLKATDYRPTPATEVGRAEWR